MKKNNIVKVEWVDSKLGSGRWEWLEEMDKPEPIACVSYGLLVYHDEEIVRVSSTHDKNLIQSCHTIDIPQSAIKRIKNLK